MYCNVFLPRHSIWSTRIRLSREICDITFSPESFFIFFCPLLSESVSCLDLFWYHRKIRPTESISFLHKTFIDIQSRFIIDETNKISAAFCFISTEIRTIKYSRDLSILFFNLPDYISSLIIIAVLDVIGHNDIWCIDREESDCWNYHFSTTQINRISIIHVIYSTHEFSA